MHEDRCAPRPRRYPMSTWDTAPNTGYSPCLATTSHVRRGPRESSATAPVDDRLPESFIKYPGAPTLDFRRQVHDRRKEEACDVYHAGGRGGRQGGHRRLVRAGTADVGLPAELCTCVRVSARGGSRMEPAEYHCPGRNGPAALRAGDDRCCTGLSARPTALLRTRSSFAMSVATSPRCVLWPPTRPEVR
jgi:hypothetical protein